TLSDPAINALPSGQWRLELRGRGIDAPRTAICRHVRSEDGFVLGDMETALNPRFEQRTGSTHEIDRGPTSVPFVIDRQTADEIRLEVGHPAAADLRLRVVPPEPHSLRYTVTAGNVVSVDAGAPAPASGPGGVTGTLGNGSLVHVDYPSAEIFPGHRRALI